MPLQLIPARTCLLYPPFQSDGIPIIQYGFTCDERSHVMQYLISPNITTTVTVCSKPEDVVLSYLKPQSKFIAAVNVALKAI